MNTLKRLIPICLSFTVFSVSANTHCDPVTPACLTEQYTMSVLWYQNSAEARAAFYQGYQLGQMRLEQALKEKSTKPLAVVLDLDETVLDDSPHQAWLIKNHKFLLDGWDEWVDMAAAEAVPGAKAFLEFADKQGVSLFYLSDRKQSQFDVTLKNLQKIGLPQADKAHLLLKTPEMKSKQGRRDRLEEHYNVVLYFGDNLADFLDSKGKSQEERNRMMEEARAEFGKRFILFPNPMYGDWYGGLIQNNFTQDHNRIYRLRMDKLRPFESANAP
ncbi:acid phosphatase [Enterobacter sp. BIGb0383]|uniref:5'-nucleotidase, lipoprotein e(P4) family n=1 Tax=unclassified Enterobacter TaxID=2608935 RepID=UPI000F48A2C2|nr:MULTISPECIES: 5'-nucleotidase, lipoprotein e(P4) family [unclassified Enterobacter]ROP59013.1 acid phosphatase [Enterobacter sp. BIGb0383]ROS09521.1 acid phosphatase [Enterobacter sp. BIGb0359]